METGQAGGTEDGQGETDLCIEKEVDSECCEDVVPPDGGFGWVIVAVAFLTGVVVDGIIFSFGILFPEVLHEFNESRSQTAWVGSVLAGTYLLVGPIVSALANTFGCRTVAIAGSFLGGAAFVGCFFANSISFLIGIYGFVGGLGLGFIYLPPIVMVSYYFEKKRAFATGIAVCGSGMGTFVMAPVSQKLIDTFGWRGNLLIQAGIILNCAVFCGFLRPLEPAKPKRKKCKKRQDTPEQSPNQKRRTFSLRKKPKTLPLLQRIKEARDATMYDSDSSLPSDTEERDRVPLAVINRYRHSIQGGTAHPTSVVRQLSNSMPSNCDRVTDTTDTPNSDSNENYLNRTRGPQMTNGGSIITDQAVHHATKDPGDQKNNSHTDTKAVSISQPQLGMGLHRLSYRRQSVLDTIKEQPVSNQHRPRYWDVMADGPQRSALPKVTPENLSRPFFRKDIFFSGSLLRIPEYTSSSDIREYRKKVTIHPDVDSVDGQSLGNYNMSETIKAMLDLSLLKSPMFFTICLSGFFTFLGLFVPFVYITDFAQTTGTSKDQAAFLLSIIGIFNTVGRVICGWLCDRPWAPNALYIYLGALIVAGVATGLAPFCKIYALQVVYSSIFGFAIACFVSLRSIVLVDLLGLEKLTNSFGLTMLFQGTASMFGSPLAGFLYGSTGSYVASFLAAGCILAFSGAMLIPLPCLARWEARRRKPQEEVTCPMTEMVPIESA